MSKERIVAIEYIRGISMLGVIGIHTGAYSLSNPDISVHLFAFLEIVTRFSVPIFFFVSAFGLFLHHNIDGPFDYSNFMKRRSQTVFLPYLTWSILYMLHYTWVSGDVLIWEAPLAIEFFLFGLASYQLYFLVILMWFYALMPLWRIAVRAILSAPRLSLSLLLLLQIAINYYSCYLLELSFSNEYLNLALRHRLSYWVIHYGFIFLLGAVCALRYQQFLAFLHRSRNQVLWFFLISLVAMVGLYYGLIYGAGYSLEAAVNTNQQLSPTGVLYTLATTLFLMMVFEKKPLPAPLSSILHLLGNHSYVVYLVHPFVMYYLAAYLTNEAIMMTEPVVIAFYSATVFVSLILARCIRLISQPLPMLSLCLTGTMTIRTKKISG